MFALLILTWPGVPCSLPSLSFNINLLNNTGGKADLLERSVTSGVLSFAGRGPSGKESDSAVGLSILAWHPEAPSSLLSLEMGVLAPCVFCRSHVRQVKKQRRTRVLDKPPSEGN